VNNHEILFPAYFVKMIITLLLQQPAKQFGSSGAYQSTTTYTCISSLTPGSLHPIPHGDPQGTTPLSLFSAPPIKGTLHHPVGKQYFRVNPNGIKPIPNFIQLHPAVLKLNYADRQHQPYMHSFHAFCAKNTSKTNVFINLHSVQLHSCIFINY
jgi:hypothetical protein